MPLSTDWSLYLYCLSWGGDVAQLVELRTGHVADAGSIPRCGEAFPSQRQLSVQTLFQCPYPLPLPPPRCAIACINICVHVKDPVDHIRVRWIMATHTHIYQARTIGTKIHNQLNDCGRSTESKSRRRTIAVTQSCSPADKRMVIKVTAEVRLGLLLECDIHAVTECTR